MSDTSIPNSLYLQTTCPLKANRSQVSNFHVCSRIPPTASCKWRNHLFIHPAALHANVGSHSSTQQNVKYLPSSNSLSRAFHLFSFLYLCSCKPQESEHGALPSFWLLSMQREFSLSQLQCLPSLCCEREGREGGERGCSLWPFHPKMPFH